MLNPAMLNPVMLNPVMLNPVMLNPAMFNRAIFNPVMLTTKIINSTILRMGLTACFFLSACTHTPIQSPTPSQPPKAAATHWGTQEGVVTFAAVGDVLMHQAVKDTAAHAASLGVGNQGYDQLWSTLHDEISSVDLAFANLETPIAPKSTLGTGAFLFNAAPIILQSLNNLGIDIVSFANNHAYDQGRQGLIETLAEIRKSPLAAIGAGDNCAQAKTALIREVNGIKVGFIGASAVFNNQLNKADTDACVNVFERASAIASVQEARTAGAEFIVYSVHWGVEYETLPTQKMIEDAHALMDAGVDVLLGHHPHVLQPVEAYETNDKRICVAIYSMGNFVSNQSRFYRQGVSPAQFGEPRDGVIFRFSAIRKNYGAGPARVELANVSVQPLWTENNWLERQKGTATFTAIRVVINDERSAELQKELTKTTDINRQIEIKKLLEIYAQRHQAASKILGEEWVYKP
jgi:soluble P-type ATPase